MAGKIKEESLLKALNELEAAVAKSDVLEDADTEGGLSSEGTPLSSKAPSGRGSVTKAAAVSSSDAGSEDAASDAGSEDAESDDAESDDAGSDDSEAPAAKSFREVADADETMQKAIEVSDFIEAMVDQTSSSLGAVTKSLHRIEKSVGARIDRSESVQQNFNARLAKAVVQIGNSVNELANIVRAFSDTPSVPQRRAVLSKSEVLQPHLGGGAPDDLATADRSKIIDWLVNKSLANQLDAVTITAFEQSGYNPDALPPMVRKALANDLAK